MRLDHIIYVGRCSKSPECQCDLNFILTAVGSQYRETNTTVMCVLRQNVLLSSLWIIFTHTLCQEEGNRFQTETS